MVSDGFGGAIVAWSDGRLAGNTDMFAQRVTGDGGVGPTVDVPAEYGATSRELVIWPNPTPGSVTFSLALSDAKLSRVEVLDLSGRLVKVVEPGEMLSPGPHSFTWDARDGAGELVGSGIYFVRVTIGGGSSTKPLAIVR